MSVSEPNPNCKCVPDEGRGGINSVSCPVHGAKPTSDSVITTFAGVDVKKLTTEDCEAINSYCESRERALLEELVGKAPTNPHRMDDQYYFDIGCAVVDKLKQGGEYERS